MEGIDPESQALLWKLHRELNGLTRARRGAGSQLQSQQSFDRAKRLEVARNRPRKTGSSSQDERDSKKRRSSDPDDEQNAHTSLQHVKREQSHEPSSHPSSGAPDGLKANCNPTTQRARQLAVLRRLSPTTAAAVAAASTVRRRAQQAPISNRGRAVKVFHAGVRWGISLPQSTLRSRTELARALNDAFAGEILSAGRGDALSFVFVDARGHASELGPAKASGARGAKELAGRWQELSRDAVRVYVKGPRDVLAAPGGPSGAERALAAAVAAAPVPS